MATCFSKGGWKNCLEQVCQQHGALSNMTPSQGRWHPSPLPDSVVRNSQGGGWGGATVTTGGWGPPWWSQIRGGHTSYLCQLHSPLVLHNLGTLEYWAAFIDVCTFDHCGFFFFYFLLKFIYFNWRLITLQYCSGFCHTLTWISQDGKDDPIGETIVFLTITKIFFSDNRGHMHVIYPPCKLQPMNHHVSLVSAPVFISWEMLEKRHSKHKRPSQEVMGRERQVSYDLAFMWNLKKWYKWTYELNYKTEMSHRCRKQIYTSRLYIVTLLI